MNCKPLGNNLVIKLHLLALLVTATLIDASPGEDKTVSSDRTSTQSDLESLAKLFISPKSKHNKEESHKSKKDKAKKNNKSEGQGGDETSSESRKYLDDCLNAHNKFRRLHGVPDLTWDNEVAAFAKKRSDHIGASDEFRHPNNLPYGENLYWQSWPDTRCEPMVRSWYDEIDLYDFNSPGFSHGTGHFTQVVWRETTKVGCAMAKSSGRRGGVYLTCNYKPPGNVIGAFEENVPRKKGKGWGGHKSKKKDKEDKKTQKDDKCPVSL